MHLLNENILMKIILIRHGKPVETTKRKLTSTGFLFWKKSYDKSKVDLTSYPSSELIELSRNALIISSKLPRAIHSAQIVSLQPPEQQFKLLNEMQLPSHPLPFKLPIYYWLFINRILWFLGFPGKVESFKQAKKRACLMAEELVNLAIENRSVVVFGHGLMNRQISKELTKLGWYQNQQGKGYWSVTKLTKQ